MFPWITFLVMLLVPNAGVGQDVMTSGKDDQIDALNAVLSFRTDLSGDTTRIARCSIIEALYDSTTISELDDRFGALLIDPPDSLLAEFDGCSVWVLADLSSRVLYLNDLIEITREAHFPLPLYESKQFEITFQLLLGRSYREFHRYLVVPSSFDPGPEEGSLQVSTWRVIEYRLAGWDFDWGNDFPASASIRR